ncbi:hypothetical protein RclHR1_09330003 [Rhizophagus clarus]|uniref:Uncharacterized protein n=1 Tax=Rhizophagus clarus TaxID=94130 RepID=A0A2Z6S3Y2_9GLOM|nr:hypothetical protein RclHR1_09330003 [Rhizophagus clarus]GES81840.1 hypothetical protein GLOIN_2v1487848 [Rhizophagus clarus]
MGNFNSSPKFTSASSSSSNSSNSSSKNSSSNSSNNSSNNNPSNSSYNSSSDTSWYNTIKDKLKDGEVCNSLGEEELNDLILSLGDETRFLNRYLNLSDLQKNDLTPSEKDRKFNVYFFISKLSDNRSENLILRYVANSLFKTRYGMFHVGLEIDGIVLEWGTGDAGPHLIYPRINTDRIYEKIAHIRVSYLSQEFNVTNYTSMWAWTHNLSYIISDVMSKVRLHSDPKIGVIPSNKLQIIAQKCVYWNKNFQYSALKHNCQHFIDEIFEALDLKFNPEGEFKKFLDRIVMYADGRFLFQEIEFLSRQDLDRYADQNWGVLTNAWDKRLLLCYSGMMNNMYEYKHDEKWGPIKSKEEWDKREYGLRI